uniref:Uncharacterized protein n=1 Tax=Arundo donax TaxID=35708 RepID=A0A0A9FPN8_ARUDO
MVTVDHTLLGST